jgi:hypothetical protein
VTWWSRIFRRLSGLFSMAFEASFDGVRPRPGRFDGELVERSSEPWASAAASFGPGLDPEQVRGLLGPLERISGRFAMSAMSALSSAGLLTFVSDFVSAFAARSASTPAFANRLSRPMPLVVPSRGWRP